MFRTIMAVVAFGLTLPAIASAQGAAASPVSQRSASGTGNLYERGEKGVESGEGEEAGFPIPVPKPERLKDGRHFVVFGKAAFYSSPKGERGQKLKPGRYELTDGRVLEVTLPGGSGLVYISMPVTHPELTPERLKDGRHFVVHAKQAFYSSPKGERGQKLKPGRYELTDGRVLEVKRDGVAALTIHMPIPLPKPVRRRR